MWRLTTHVVTHYMYNHGEKLNGFNLNKLLEKIMANGITKVKNIRLKHIRCQEAPVGGWQVQSQSIQRRWYDIVDPYTSYTSCSCG